MTSLETLENLPRFKATRHLIETQGKCEVCQETFVADEEVLALPCIHQLYAPQRPPSITRPLFATIPPLLRLF
jgi:hypothetical protein